MTLGGLQLPYPWPRKPPSDARCDATSGVSVDAFRQPRVSRCSHPATETLWSLMASVSRELWLCTCCADKYVSLGYAVRNPRAGRR